MSERMQSTGRHPGMRPEPAARQVRGGAPRRLRLRGLFTRQRLILAGACLFGGAVVVNALMLQTGKHPSPMFRTIVTAAKDFPIPPQRPGGQEVRSAAFAPRSLTPGKPMPIERPENTRSENTRSENARPAQPVAVDAGEALLAEIQRELGKRGYYKGEPDGKTGPKTTQAIRDFQFSQRVAIDGRPSEALLQAVLASKVTMKDELLDLVRRTSQNEPAKGTVADIQRALNKAGYGPVDEDGHMGPTTRQALARFEADRKLPPRGEPKGPVLKLLASASGVPIKQP